MNQDQPPASVTAKRLTGSTTEFEVLGESKTCRTPGCHWVAPPGSSRADALVCGRCGKRLETARYRVDTAAYAPVGSCSCPAFQLLRLKSHGFQTRKQVLDRMTRKEREALTTAEKEALRCKHVKEARQAALDEAILNHEAERMAGLPRSAREEGL